jgi:D-alanyl-D-alanine carboxypeptidase (penicillin-binding protein 5/6)
VRGVIFIGLWLLSHTLWAAAQPDPFPQVGAAYLVEVDGTGLWNRHANQRLPIASLTKLMTALLVLEQGDLDKVASVSPAATRETGSRIAIKAAERFHVQDLLAASLIASANDACHALADHLAGNESAFVQRMNQRAQQLGLRDTRFRNACGHDAPGHYSTARDISLLARELLKYPSLLPLTSQRTATISTLDGKRYSFNSKNALIGRYAGTLGLKTGYTAQAGKCLVAYVKRDGHDVLLVLLHGKDRWWDAADILDLAFAYAQRPH